LHPKLFAKVTQYRDEVFIPRYWPSSAFKTAKCASGSRKELVYVNRFANWTLHRRDGYCRTTFWARDSERSLRSPIMQVLPYD